MTLTDDTIYFGSNYFNPDVGRLDGAVCALDFHDGLKWKVKIDGRIDAAPAIATDGTIYVGTGVGYLYAIAPDGRLRWRFATDGQILSSPSIGYDGTIYFVSGDGNLYALNPDGSFKWGYPHKLNNFVSPIVGLDGTVYGASGSRVYAFSHNGSLKWESDSFTNGIRSMALDPGRSIYVGSKDGKLYALELSSQVKWSFATKGSGITSDINALAVDSSGTIFVGAAEDNNLYALNPDGTLKWKFDTGSFIQNPIAIGSDGTIYTGKGQAISSR